MREGETVTLAGRTGVGKTTLFKLILGLYAPRTGNIRICGLDPRAIPAEKRRPLCCCVEQEFTAIDGSVRDQITLRGASRRLPSKRRWRSPAWQRSARSCRRGSRRHFAQHSSRRDSASCSASRAPSR
ncbi:ATP-binding cassette domain-containing protein [Mitsuokella multacida]|uniref:ATP-binding cassette domain-containing protein n=1 Tax=Mitsuokella multacida TaxID=52226 RepID=UPI00242A3B22|nr:ATP-binding cassette domain-containing protein [Mitsuokella multacida]